MLKNIYSNTASTGFTVDFFGHVFVEPKKALLASPFYTTYSPIEKLTAKGCEVLLIVRLCEATDPSSLRKALADPLVSIRYYTDRKFHPKLYIVDDVALVGSANLTRSGLEANREVSVVLMKDRDVAFQSLPMIFDNLWDYADVLSKPILDEFEKICKRHNIAQQRRDFEKDLEVKIPAVSPQSIVVGSNKISKQRSFLQSFRRKYDEILVPLHQEIMTTALAAGFGRPEYVGADPQIEMGRFLGWVRLVYGQGDMWRETPIGNTSERAARISQYVSEWQSTSDTVSRDMYEAERELQNIAYIKEVFNDASRLNGLSYDEIFEGLIGCHAFLEQLRFTKGGLEGLRTDFAKRNKLSAIKSTLTYLLHGQGDQIQRAYDCLYDEKYRLERFGEASIMELVGWSSSERPPFNNRTIRGMRFLGYDVERFVAGA